MRNYKIHKMLLNMQSIADLTYLYVIYMIFDSLACILQNILPQIFFEEFTDLKTNGMICGLFIVWLVTKSL